MSIVQITAVDGHSHFIQQLASNNATRQALHQSTRCWAGFIEGQVVCLWGLISPTVMSDQAYLWLHVTEGFEGHEFLFVRHSQRMIEAMLQEYPYIRGHVEIENNKALRWIRWLGASFGEPEGKRIPFRIRRK